MDRINELLARLSALNAEELAELDTLIGVEVARLADAAVTEENVAELDTLAGIREQLATETTARETAQAALEARREEALARLRPAENSADSDEDQDAQDDGADTDAEGEADAQTADGDAQDGDVQAVAASGNRAAAPARPAAAAARPTIGQLATRRPAANRPDGRAGSSSLRATTRIASGLTGQELTSRDAMVMEMTRAISSSGPGVTAITASTRFPAERMLRQGHDAANEALVAAALAPDALVAAGGLCAPVENLYDVNVVGTTERPVRDMLPTFGADRGGVSLRQSPVFQDWAGANGTWTNQNDIDAATVGSPDPTKNIIEAICPGFTPFYTQAIYQRVRFRNVTARFDPEGTRANMDAADIAWARLAENELLTKIAALSKPLTGGRVLGASRDILAHFDKLIAWWKSLRRIGDNTRLHVVTARWVKDMLRADITRGSTDPDMLALADAQIQAWFAARNLNVTWHLDGRAAAQSSGSGIPAIAAQQYGVVTAGSAVPGFPAQIELGVYVEGDFLLLDAGEINLGTVRDTATNQVNAYEIFKEGFEGVAFRGIEAVQFVISTEPTGLHAGSFDTSAVTD